jgi:S4 domain.
MPDVGGRVDKLLARIGLAESVSDAARKIKAGAVEIDGARQSELILGDVAGTITIRAGRKWKKVRL